MNQVEARKLGRRWKVSIEGRVYYVLAHSREEAATTAGYTHAARDRTRYGRTRGVYPWDGPAHFWLVGTRHQAPVVVSLDTAFLPEDGRVYYLPNGELVEVYGGADH